MIGETEQAGAYLDVAAASVPDVTSAGEAPPVLARMPPVHAAGVMVDYLAATDDDTRAEAVRSLQRTSGNRAVTRMLARAPVEAPAPPAEEAPRSMRRRPRRWRRRPRASCSRSTT